MNEETPAIGMPPNIHAVFWMKGRSPNAVTVDASYGSYEAKKFLEGALDVLDWNCRLQRHISQRRGSEFLRPANGGFGCETRIARSLGRSFLAACTDC